ncbi:hypothetical protein [Vibrio sp. T11.5]|uniref:hypothetical protein n=1 Tax=Vibrio sp. T11.5 TaxID=2998836 RepID=UPI0022CD441D|nr:hypothetical protein [Vibrio sp. T11.5]MDA0120617.1 hypothetical protein [Vibrio sp. T11.5]
MENWNGLRPTGTLRSEKREAGTDFVLWKTGAGFALREHCVPRVETGLCPLRED